MSTAASAHNDADDKETSKGATTSAIVKARAELDAAIAKEKSKVKKDMETKAAKANAVQGEAKAGAKGPPATAAPAAQPTGQVAQAQISPTAIVAAAAGQASQPVAQAPPAKAAVAEVSSSVHPTELNATEPGLAQSQSAAVGNADKKKWLFGDSGGGGNPLHSIIGGATNALKGVIGKALPDDMPGGDIVKGLVNTGLDAGVSAGMGALDKALPQDAKIAIQQASGIAQMAAGIVEEGKGKRIKKGMITALHKLAEDTNFVNQFAAVVTQEEAKEENQEPAASTAAAATGK